MGRKKTEPASLTMSRHRSAAGAAAAVERVEAPPAHTDVEAAAERRNARVSDERAGWNMLRGSLSLSSRTRRRAPPEGARGWEAGSAEVVVKSFESAARF